MAEEELQNRTTMTVLKEGKNRTQNVQLLLQVTQIFHREFDWPKNETNREISQHELVFKASINYNLL